MQAHRPDVVFHARFAQQVPELLAWANQHLVFILGITDSHSHLNALQELAGIIRTKTVCDGLRRCDSAEAAMQVLLTNSSIQ